MICGINKDGSGTYTAEGIDALCEALKSTTTLTSLKYASQLESIPTFALTAYNTLCPRCSQPRQQCAVWHQRDWRWQIHR